MGNDIAQRLAEIIDGGYNPHRNFLREILAEIERLHGLLNTPEIEDWAKGVVLEAAHQVDRWGKEQDTSKYPADWFWLLGYLGGKALASDIAGDREKARHHTISAGAALAHWHNNIGEEECET